jgi:putative RecB family exonuclease
VASYSPSKLAQYVQCQLKYRFQYVDGIKKDSESIEAFMGSRVHEALERVLKLKKDFDKEPSYELAEEIFCRTWDEKFHPAVVIREPDVTPEDYKRRGLMMLRNYFDIDSVHDFGEIVDMELRLNFQIGEHSVNGIVDRLQREGGRLHIIDYKTSKGRMTQDQADRDRQLAIYELGLRQLYPDAEEIELHWYMLAHKDVVTSTRDAEARRRLEDQVSSLIEEIESATDFRPSEGTLCGWCDYAEECAAEKEIRTLTPDASLTAPIASELADEYAELAAKQKELNSLVNSIKKRLEELKPLLGEACRQEGAWSVEGTDCILDILEKYDYSMPSKGSEQRRLLEELIRESGLWEELSDINKSLIANALSEGRFGNAAPDVEGTLGQSEQFNIKIRRKDEPERHGDV